MGSIRFLPPHAALHKRLPEPTALNAVMPTPANPPSHAFTYGAHMAVNMAIGFLFLGAGSLTFGTSKEAGKHW